MFEMQNDITKANQKKRTGTKIALKVCKEEAMNAALSYRHYHPTLFRRMFQMPL